MTCSCNVETDSPIFTKDPDAELDYTRTWADWLAAGEVISESSWSIELGGGVDDPDTTLEKDVQPASKTDQTATVWLGGGTPGASYFVTNRVTTDQGRTDDRTFTVVVEER